MSLAQILEHTRGRLERLGNAVTSYVWRLGFASRFLFYMVVHSGTALRRFRLTVAEIYFAGVLSLIIILVSGLFVGMVLALQGYDTLQRFGAVSEQTAREMAKGALRRSRASISVAITGIAGPGGSTPEKPVGTVCFAWAQGRKLRSETRRFGGGRCGRRRRCRTPDGLRRRQSLLLRHARPDGEPRGQ